jgi:hypothetical protein
MFTRKALIAGAFEKSLFLDKEVIEVLIKELMEGTSTNYILNVLLLTDISVWKNNEMQTLINTLEGFAGGYDDNKLILSYNPMMTIALSAEIL